MTPIENTYLKALSHQLITQLTSRSNNKKIPKTQLLSFSQTQVNIAICYAHQPDFSLEYIITYQINAFVIFWSYRTRLVHIEIANTLQNDKFHTRQHNISVDSAFSIIRNNVCVTLQGDNVDIDDHCNEIH